MKYLYKYPQARLPVRRAGARPIAGAAATSPSTSCSTRASSTRTVISTCSWNTPRNRPKTSWCRSPSTIAARSRRSSTCCRRFGSATAGRGATTIRARCSSTSPASPASFGQSSAIWASAIFYCDGQASLLFTENETNTQRLFGVQNRTPFVKDGINNYIVHGQRDAVNPQQTGTKVAAHYRLTVPPGKSRGGSPAAHAGRAGRSEQELRQRQRRIRQTFRRDHARRAGRRPTSSTPRSFRARSMRMRPTSCARRWPGCCGPSSSTIST